MGTVIVAPLGDKGVAAYDWAKRALLWKAMEGEPVFSSPAPADLDADGRMEVVVGTWKGDMAVLDLETGDRLWGIKIGEKPIEADPVVADLDRDGIQDILIADWSGTLQAISGLGTIGARRARREKRGR